MMVPPLTTLNHGGWEIGIRAGEEILRRLRDSESKPLSLEIPVSLVVRESTAPPPQ
jgi:DNA-binding LacI/PurR family transcriptional regulator